MQTVSYDLSKIQPRLQRLYGERADEAAAAITAALERVDLDAIPATDAEPFDERDVVLITYGDQIRSEKLNPLQTLHKFLTDWELPALINTVHFLPCFPYTSDDGFSVVDYRQVDPALGTWDDVHAIGRDCRLMLDLVLNHISQASDWFQQYLAGESPYDQFFIEADPTTDLSEVTRPRSLPLLSDFETSRGTRWLWTTFSRDQVDLNYAEPKLLAEMLGILLEYVAHGARIVRLDAIAYLWKRIGTNCIHLEETHEVVKLMRDLFDQLAPQALLLTETNVPHEENVSYFGDGDEAHMVYQFSLPPLLLDAFLNEDALPLKRWLKNLQSPPPGTTYFNFTASHDGVGVRPLEGHVDDDRLQRMVERVRSIGGEIGTRRQPDGSDSPYEMNVSYISALTPESGDVGEHAQRFLASQAVMLALQGMPAIYFHSLVGTENDLQGVRESGIPRRINRRKFDLHELTERLNESDSLANLIFAGLRRLVAIRIAQSAFHPNAQQNYWESGSDHVLGFERKNERTGQAILCAANFGDDPTVIELPPDYWGSANLLDASTTAADGKLTLAAAQVVWLEANSRET